MIRRSSRAVALAVGVAALIAACGGGGPSAPPLTDPEAIVTAALDSTLAARSVHLDVAVDGTATVALPGIGGPGTPVELDGTTASIDVDTEKPAAHATFSVPALLNFAGEAIAIDGKVYLRTTLTGPLYQESPAQGSPLNPAVTDSVVDGLGDLLLGEGVTLVKGEDVACGSEQCYTVSADLTAASVGAAGAGAIAGLPIDLDGASLKLTVRVEKDLPHHLAGLTAVVTMADGSAITIDVTASKWDEPVSIAAPPADKVKPAS